ncbi:flagellar basal body-associated FliL family protein [Yoonia sp.]|uniref:flagellar basal body-associated FliL family protein n=1 Tax=Yoonia sp. TaxID=2212373 RepID=UPI0019F4C242|nr:flagellar basal body-associated FliL family protein [Yoonia sp.]MBE0413785.1 flagellar basal body-associated FliL family protein [Yoonia sp.]
MKSFLVPLFLLFLGVGAGAGAGFYLLPAPTQDAENLAAPCGDPDDTASKAPIAPAIPEEREYAKLNNQFIVPVVKDGKIAALVVLSLNLEVAAGSRTAVFATEPKLRDSFLQAMFDHANNDGFSGNFTSGEKMFALRKDLLRRAKDIIGAEVTDVLITDIVRQDT